MASEPPPPPPPPPPAAPEEANFKTLVLKVSIHCEGCKRKVSKILSKIEGVESVHVDTRQNRVSFRSLVDAQTVIQKLKKHGKLAELLAEAAPSDPVPKPAAAEAEKPPPPDPAKASVERSSSSPSSPAPTEAVTVKTVDNSVIEAEAQEPKPEPKKPEKVNLITGDKNTDTEKSKKVKDEHTTHRVFPPQPAYVTSYNMVEPSMSQPHFEPPRTTIEMSSQGHMYDDQYRYPLRYYDGPVEAYPNPTGYVNQSANDPYNTMFSDENPDSSCTLM